MRRLVGSLALLLGMISAATSAETYTPGRKIDKSFNDFVRPFLVNNCVDCHSGKNPKGNLSLHNLGPVDEVNAATWKTIWAQVALKEMPPKQEEQPGVVERLQFSDWIVGELTRVMRDKGGFVAHLDPEKGNYVDHNLLFGPLPAGIQLVPTATPARLWRVTPQEHMTRLNDLINTEPKFDPKNPGLRAHGDFIPVNHLGDLKLYFGLDNIIYTQGKEWGLALKGVSFVLAWARNHGLKNYPNLYTVNGAEATQLLTLAEDIIRYMAHGPLSIAEPVQISDDRQVLAEKLKGIDPGSPLSLGFSTKFLRPQTPVYDLFRNEGVDDNRLRAAVDYMFEALTFRPPTNKESDDYLAIVKQSIDKLGKKDGVVLGLSSIFLDRDALFRPELVASGTPDQHGRIMLQDWELGLAVNHALRYIRPDEALRTAIVNGRMRTREDVRREVQRMLSDPAVRKPRVLQFFRDYFDYDLAATICKDGKALAETDGNTYREAVILGTPSTDRLVELILEKDKDVLKQLLTTNQVVAGRRDAHFFGERLSREETAAAVAADAAAAAAAPKGEKRIMPKHLVKPANLTGPKTFVRANRSTQYRGPNGPDRILATVPEGQRLGILTHPIWLIAQSDAMDNHAIHRGKWIRERLLGGGIPDVPITVDAMLPDEPKNTLRERMRVTREPYCWTCHKKMDPLGLPFEMYNHVGMFRRTELDKPVDTTGEIIESGDPSLDGKVANAIELIQKIAASQRAEQVFVRHAFRFWMGRNETLNDAPVLQAAHRAYRDGGGSMNALLVSLLTSDAFLYRTRNSPTEQAR